MEENPYQSPVEASVPIAPEHDDWSATLRRWAFGPRMPLAWFVIAGAIAVLVAAMLG